MSVCTRLSFLTMTTGRLDELSKLRKACGCSGTSSGPRVVLKDVTAGGRLDPEAYTTKIIMAPMVCDVCNSPWEVLS